MVRKQRAMGMALCSFGVGLVVAVLFESGFFLLLVGILSIVSGCILMNLA
jgi:lipopolysaccharide export LptBFGC system permease protein LptF